MHGYLKTKKCHQSGCAIPFLLFPPSLYADYDVMEYPCCHLGPAVLAVSSPPCAPPAPPLVGWCEEHKKP